MNFANVGSADRIFRVLLGVALILLPLLGVVTAASSSLGMLMIAAGAVLIVTGFMSFCPLYHIIGASTRKS